MIKEYIHKSVDRGRIRWQRHALERMMERGIFRDDVKKVLTEGELIEKYPDDQPFPSGLFLGFPGADNQPLHVVATFDSKTSGVTL
ncbi:DUF4258 domain-containing protein [Halalkalibaculum sp. DA384]|uniref:DUF4258 domain-containing protein n=1 Tax=Halalkalibaculum sp. DA384 TaxID=3373606 RepID=UPI00375521E3